MFWRILKKDLKRKKTMNIILMMFIILASMFVASALNNIITVANGTGYYMDIAGVGDYVVITQGENCYEETHKFIDEHDILKDSRTEEIIFASEGCFFRGDEKLSQNNVTFIQPVYTDSYKFFDMNNNELAPVNPGEVYISNSNAEKNNLKVGDLITVKMSGYEGNFKFMGGIKDALLGSDMMGNARFIISEEDFAKMNENEEIASYCGGVVINIETDDTAAVSAAYSDAGNIVFDGSRSMITTCYVMDMIIAGVLLVVSVCLIIVAFMVLKFTITFTLQEEFREIGVMKAIGITNFKIRSLYLTKYLGMGILGSLIGFFGSIPFGNAMLNKVTKNMVLGNGGGYTPNVIGAVIVIIIILLFAYRCTKLIKKNSPIDAIRNGQTGERYKHKTGFRITKSHTGVPFYLAVNDIKSSVRRFLTIIITFSICALLPLIIGNTAATMKSDKLISLFTGKVSDVYYTDVNAVMENMNKKNRDSLKQSMKEKEKILEENGMPGDISICCWYKYKVKFAGNDFNITCEQGLNYKTEDCAVTEGYAPTKYDEIAITKQISDLTGAKIGDKITIEFADGPVECMVTGYFNSMCQLGKTIRLHQDAPTNNSILTTTMGFQIDFKDSPSEKEISNRVERLKTIFDNDEIFDSKGYTKDCIKVVDIMDSVEVALVAIMIIVIILITILMERSLVSDEKGQIAILKAIGFSDGNVIAWHVIRFAILSIIAVFISVALSIPCTNLFITPIFRMMGASEIDYAYDLTKILLVYPAIVLVATVCIATITALYTKKIKASDTASIE